MDAKASTHLCVSPVAATGPDTKVSAPASAYMIVVGGGIPGTMLRLSDDQTSLGRSAECSFQLFDISVSRRHAVISIDKLGVVHLTDQQSTNGTFVNGNKVVAHRAVRLDDGDRIQLGTNVVLKLVRLDPSDERFQREMFERTVRDTLTGLYNRSYFLDQIGQLAERNAPHGIGLAVLMLDIDYFKRINDRFGHLVGDAVLREVAEVIRESTRAEDLVARYGGEEFVIALPVSVPDLATERAERIRWNITERRIPAGDTDLQVTASIGLAYSPPGRARGEMGLIMTADQALYQAKADGRNRVVFGHQAMLLAPKQTASAEFPVIK